MISDDYSGETELIRLALHSIGFEGSNRAHPNKVAHNIQHLSNIDRVIKGDYSGEAELNGLMKLFYRV